LQWRYSVEHCTKLLLTGDGTVFAVHREKNKHQTNKKKPSQFFVGRKLDVAAMA
jgi:hypothetical protein